MPRKMAGIAMITIEASIVAIVMLSVVLDSAIHLYRSGRPPFGCDPPDAPFTYPKPTLCRTLTQSTAKHLLNGNYLPWTGPSQTTGSSPPEESGAAGDAGVRSTM